MLRGILRFFGLAYRTRVHNLPQEVEERKRKKTQDKAIFQSIEDSWTKGNLEEFGLENPRRKKPPKPDTPRDNKTKNNPRSAAKDPQSQALQQKQNNHNSK